MDELLCPECKADLLKVGIFAEGTFNISFKQHFEDGEWVNVEYRILEQTGVVYFCAKCNEEIPTDYLGL